MIEIILDASQIEVFEHCPKKWYYDYILNLTTVHPNPALSTGTYYHEVLKFYYSNKLDLRGALMLAQKLALGERRVEWPAVAAEPKFHLERLKNYLIYNRDDDETDEVIAVEQGFSYLLYEDDYKRFILEGMIDWIGHRKHLGLTVRDHKTQSRMYDKYEINHQVFNYLNFTKANYFEYNFIGLQDVTNHNTFRRPIYKPHPGMLTQWKLDVIRTFHEMYKYLNSHFEQSEKFPRRRSACDGKFGLCQFHHLCQVPDSNTSLVKIVSSKFKQKDNKWKAWS